MIDEMLEKARRNAKVHADSNVEFRRGDIENEIPVKDGSADLVTSNCVINLTIGQAKRVPGSSRILKRGGRMVISDLVSDEEVVSSSATA